MFTKSDLLRLVDGDCSPGEAAAIQDWIAADPRRGALLDDLQALWRATGSATRRWDVAGARRRLREDGSGTGRPFERAASSHASKATSTSATDSWGVGPCFVP